MFAVSLRRRDQKTMHSRATDVRGHLMAQSDYQRRSARFIENHDEPRAAATFADRKARAAATTILTLPGAKLLHEGQLDGRHVKLPVQLGRRPAEPADADLQEFYARLLRAIRTPALRAGEWRLCERSGWPDNQSCLNLVAWCWRQADERRLIVVNLSEAPSQGLIRMPWDDLAGRSWRLTDVLTQSMYDRNGTDMHDAGLYVELNPWHVHFLAFSSRP